MQVSYLFTLTALIVHQVDAAFWHEWEMFLLPGGIQGFLLFNILIVPALLWGFQQVILQNSKARFYGLFCGGLGILTALIHLSFYLFGFEQFNLPLSWLTLFACLISGIWLIVKTLQDKIQLIVHPPA